MRKSIWQRVKPWCVPLVLTLLIYIMLRSVFLIGYVPSASMEPTLHEGSFILGLRLYSEPKVGDIIIFEKDGVLLVKRMVPSRFMRKFICRLRLNEVSRQ